MIKTKFGLLHSQRIWLKRDNYFIWLKSIMVDISHFEQGSMITS